VHLSDSSSRSHNEVASYKADLETAYMEQGNAIRACRDGIVKEPKNFWLWKNLVKLLAVVDIETALLSCEEAIKKHRHFAPSIMAVILYAAKGEYVRAIEAMRNIRGKTLDQGLKEALKDGKDTGSAFGLPSPEERDSLEG